MDVESLFNNVPVDGTIEMILERVYKDPSTDALNIREQFFRSLLEICTKKAPFINHHRYLQFDGVAMGSPLGVLFANFYTVIVEERVFRSIRKPSLYVRYIDGTFTQAGTMEEIEELRQALHTHSCLRFTTDHSRLPFLDVLVEHKEGAFAIRVHTKPTNLGMCLNGESECPERYKDTTISAYVRRALFQGSTMGRHPLGDETCSPGPSKQLTHQPQHPERI
ncbi:uncharacterized protein LOC135222357 [Macrobrachium nipponense]|uniref:uncharacterized protein LOC135222357 n=1 Tax=Macrobrachium nipponense TaxID=159736 RepID=UPI0030C82769